MTLTADRTDETIRMATSRGWILVHRDAIGAQFRKPKEWSKGLLIWGFALLVLFGFGLLLLLAAVIDYLIKKDQLAYISQKDLSSGAWLPRTRT